MNTHRCVFRKQAWEEREREREVCSWGETSGQEIFVGRDARRIERDNVLISAAHFKTANLSYFLKPISQPPGSNLVWTSQ